MDKNRELDAGFLSFTKPSIAEKISSLDFSDISDQTAIETLKKHLGRLSAHTIESFRPMKKFDIELLTNEMEKTLQANHEGHILPDTIYRFFKGIQKFCVEYSRQRGL